ncbi:hypothetical protein EYS14_24260 [Alteromonadaceae bacterium M269]|nr:hypothetical protein EYS14_24260 [Alteromonadaceae bacterium M269]
MTNKDPTANSSIIKRLDKFHDDAGYLLKQVIQTLALITNNGEPTWKSPDQVIDILLGFEDKLKTIHELTLALELS